MTTSAADETRKKLTIDDFKVGQRVRYKYDGPGADHYLNGDGTVVKVFPDSRTVKVAKDSGGLILYGQLNNFEILEQPKEPEDKAKLPDINKFKLSMSDEALAQEYRYGAARQAFLRLELEKRGYKVSIRRDNSGVIHLPKACPISHIYLKKTVTEEIVL